MAQCHSSAALFHSYGRICASHPWEVIIAVLTIFMCLSMAPTASSFHNDSQRCNVSKMTQEHLLSSYTFTSPHSILTQFAPAWVSYYFLHLHQTPTVDSTYIQRTSSLSSSSQSSSSSSSSSSSPSSPSSSSSPLPSSTVSSPSHLHLKQESTPESGALLLVTRFLAFLYFCSQLRSLYKLGSKYLVGIAVLFTVVSSFIFTSTVINVLKKDFSELNTAWPFFLLWTILPKTSQLAQFALSSDTREEVRENIAKGMQILGPCLTLDSIVVTLAIGMGTLIGDHKTEELSYLACLSVVVYYIVFMTLFPACLSLVLELSYSRCEGRPVWQLSSLTKALQLEQTPNPVIQWVKVVMSCGLMLVHAVGRFQVDGDTHSSTSQSHPVDTATARDTTDDFLESNYFKRQFGGEQILLIGLVCALAIKYVFFDTRESDSLLDATSTIARASVLSATSPSSTNYSYMKMFPQSTCPSSLPAISLSEPESPVRANASTSTDDTPGDDNSPSSTYGSGNSNRLNATDCRLNGQQSFYISDSESSSDSCEVDSVDKEVQTIESNISEVLTNFKSSKEARSLEECLVLLNCDDGVAELTDEEVLNLVQKGKLPSYRLESALNNPSRGVHIRRLLLNRTDPLGSYVSNLPFLHYDYSAVMGACCENVIGYVPIPVGVAGPLLLNGTKYHVPMATTEGCLVASTNRGCRALTAAGGVQSSLVSDSMTRAPVVSFPSASRAAEVMNWLAKKDNFAIIKEAFDSTSRFARLNEIKTSIAANLLYIRLSAETGDAMGMNMLSKGAEIAMKKLKGVFPDMTMVALSGNVCTDKKPSAINWIEGRGKSVVCEATIPASVLETVLKTTAESLEQLNLNKNLIGSALAGSIGGFNAHAANIVTAIYIATGQDPAQNVGSSNCMTLVRATGLNRKDLYVSCTMPSIEVGTIGGGTILSPQASCLQLLGVRGSCNEEPGKNARTLASVVCAAVLAGELSVLSALATGDLVRSHMKHNRSSVSVNATNPNELLKAETNLKLGTCVQ